MRGYATLISEIYHQLSSEYDINPLDGSLTHVFLQVGAGLFAAGMTNAMIVKARESGLDKLPKLLAVEARGAHCFYHTHQQGDGEIHCEIGRWIRLLFVVWRIFLINPSLIFQR